MIVDNNTITLLGEIIGELGKAENLNEIEKSILEHTHKALIRILDKLE